MLHQDEGADRQPARRKTGSDSGALRRQSCVRSPLDGTSRTDGNYTRLDGGKIHRGFDRQTAIGQALSEFLRRLRQIPRGSVDPKIKGKIVIGSSLTNL